MNILNWIAIEKELPSDSDHVLVTDGKNISIANYFGEQTENSCDAPHLVGQPKWANQHFQLIGRHINEVTHWLPMSAIDETLEDTTPPQRNILFISGNAQICVTLEKLLKTQVESEINVMTTVHSSALEKKFGWKDNQTNVEIWLSDREPSYYIEIPDEIVRILNFDYIYIVTEEKTDDYQAFNGHKEDGIKFTLVKNRFAYVQSPYQWVKLDLSDTLEILNCPALRKKG